MAQHADGPVQTPPRDKRTHAARDGTARRSEVDHEPCADDLVVATAVGDGSLPIGDSTVDEVELHPGVGVPVPVDAKRQGFPDTTGDSLVGEVGVRPPQGELPLTGRSVSCTSPKTSVASVST